MSFWRLYYHLVWCTKNREYLIQPAVERRLFPYLVGKAAESDVFVYALNGWFDHFHMVVAIPPKHAVADIVKRLKGASSYDMNSPARSADTAFAWQPGYGVISLGEKQKPVAITYVENQKQHHTEQTTNAWLEQMAELEEGPEPTGIKPGQVLPRLREDGTRYDTLGDLPF